MDKMTLHHSKPQMSNLTMCKKSQYLLVTMFTEFLSPLYFCNTMQTSIDITLCAPFQQSIDCGALL